MPISGRSHGTHRGRGIKLLNRMWLHAVAPGTANQGLAPREKRWYMEKDTTIGGHMRQFYMGQPIANERH